MGSGKLDKKGRQQRREDLIRYIRENGPVSSSQICRELGTSRSSLSDDLRAINLGGNIILSPSRGLYVFNSDYDEQVSPHCRIDREAVRQWTILLSLSGNDRTFSEIEDFLVHSGIPCTSTSLYKDLTLLQQIGLVSRRPEGRARYYHSGSLHETDPSEVRRFYQSSKSRSARLSIEDLHTLDLKIKHSVGFLAKQIHGADDNSSIATDKKSLLTRKNMEMLENFEKYPFAKKALRIQYMTEAGDMTECVFQTGIIVYLVETSRIYLIGKDLKARFCIIPLDQVVSIAVSRRNNVCYDTSEFHSLYREMFHISTDDPVQVRVRFENYSFTRDKIEMLCKIRGSGRMEIINNEIVYTDTIRGEKDFAGFLRRFGPSAIVDAPQSLRQFMIETSRLTIERYAAHPEYKEGTPE